MSHALRPRFEEALEDALLFSKEFLLVLWRHNPAGVAAYLCRQLDAAVTENTPPPQKAAMVSEGITGIEIPPVEAFETQFAETIAAVAPALTSETITSAIKDYPDIEGFLRESLAHDESAIAASFARMTRNAVSQQRSTYAQLHAHYQQLVEFLPRYTSVMNRSQLLDGVVSFFAGFFGGYAGAAGAEAWSNWRTSNDKDFCQKFVTAFCQFIESCETYTIAGEQSLSVVFDRLLDEVRDFDHRLFDCYDQLATEGWDITPLYKRYTTPNESIPEDARHLFETAIANLEANRSIHYRRIENIRRIIGLDVPASSALPANDGPSPRPAVAGEPPAALLTSSTAPSEVQSPRPPATGLDADIVRSLVGDFSCKRFYVTPHVPPDVAQRAIGSYAPHLKPGDVLLLADTTIFGTATEGFLLTAHALHWRNTWSPAKQLPFTELKTVAATGMTGFFETPKITANGEDIDTGVSDMEKQKDATVLLATLLERAMSMRH